MISAKVSEMTSKFILGKRPLSEFDAYVQELMDLGLKECLDIRQNAYDEYKAK